MAFLTNLQKLRLAWIVVLCMLSAHFVHIAANPNCPSTQTSCECIRGIHFELACPTYLNPNISVRVEEQSRQSNRLEIECNTIDDKIYKMLPEVFIGDVSMAKFKFCPMPIGMPINQILKRLGVQSVQGLTLTSRSDDSIVRQHLTGLKNLTRLSLNGFGKSNVPEDLFHDVTSIMVLEFRAKDMHLPPKIFEKLPELTFLELGFNNLTHLSDGIFQNQKKLKNLNLWGNNLRNLSKDAFYGVTSNVELDLSNNNIETLQPDVFEHLTNLTLVSLNGNHIIALPEGLFTGNKNLEKFLMINNRVELEALPNAFLADLPALNEVQIQCALKILPENTFAESPNIVHIALKDNALQTLPPRLLATQRNLELLDLSSNQLIELADNLFNKTAKLKVLRLSHNRLTRISDRLLSSLVNLEELYLDNNRLEHIGSEAFANTNLKVIHLQYNSLTFDEVVQGPTIFSEKSPFQDVRELRKLNLSHNKVATFLVDWFMHNTHLETLDLSYNNFTFINFEYITNTWLSQLTVDLRHNRIRYINVPMDKDLQGNGLKPTWILNENPLNCDCLILFLVKSVRGELGKPKANYVIDNLRCAEPARFEGQFVSTMSPQELLCPLDSEHTTLKYCPTDDGCSCWYRRNDESAIINCSDANLTRFPNITQIKNVKVPLKIIELHLDNNKITHLPLAYAEGYKNLTHLYMRNNSIAMVRAENLPPKLAEIDLSHNELTKLNATLIAYLNMTPTLKRIRLGQNPWICDCDTILFRSFIFRNTSRIADHVNVTCSEGGARIIDMDDLCSLNKTIFIMISILVALLGLFIGAVVALYYKYQQEVKVWLFAHNLCLWLWSEEDMDKDKKYDAFISFSHVDESFVTEHLVPELETGPHPFKLCLHFRDWVVGEFIPTQIARSVEDARRTIIVLSPNFLQSVWSRMEFQAAHKAALEEKRVRVIVIIYGDIGDIDKLDPELKCYLKTNTYIKWGDPWFFDKLRYALPHPTNYKSKGLIKSTIKSSIDDKLELIKPISVTPPLTTPPAEQAGNNPMVARLNAENGQYISNGLNGMNGHVNSAFIINPNAKQSDV